MNILTPCDPSFNYSDPLSVNDRSVVWITTFAPCLRGKRERKRREKKSRRRVRKESRERRMSK
jgi:hypothetical protein